MFKFNSTKTAISLILISALASSFAGCGKEPEVTVTESETTTTVMTTTTEATTTVPTYSGPMQTQSLEVTWTETEITETVKYVYCSAGSFINVRSGPGTEFDVVAHFTSDMEVIVVAVTNNGWYKLNDGFYVSGDFLTDLPSSN